MSSELREAMEAAENAPSVTMKKNEPSGELFDTFSRDGKFVNLNVVLTKKGGKPEHSALTMNKIRVTRYRDQLRSANEGVKLEMEFYIGGTTMDKEESRFVIPFSGEKAIKGKNSVGTTIDFRVTGLEFLAQATQVAARLTAG